MGGVLTGMNPMKLTPFTLTSTKESHFNQEYIDNVISLLSLEVPKEVGGIIVGFSVCFLSSPRERSYKEGLECSERGAKRHETKEFEKAYEDLILGDELTLEIEGFNFHFIADYDQRSSKLVLFQLGTQKS